MANSQFRHIYAEVAKLEKSYLDVNVSTTSIDTNLLAANYKYVAFPNQTSGGGSFTVLSLNGNGKLTSNTPVFSSHSANVLDLNFHPFNDDIIISGAEDASIRLWKIKMENDKVLSNNEPLSILKGHGKRIGRVLCNPLINNLLASFGQENSIKLWDISNGESINTFKAGKESLLDLNWNQYGNLLAYPMKDKKLHCLDIKSNLEIFSINSHAGLRGSRVVFYDKLNFIITTGFSSTSSRQIIVRDYRNPEKILSLVDVDSNNGILAPFIDQDLGILTCFSRGDSLIRVFDLQSEEKPIITCNSSSTGESVRAFANAPKYCVQTNICEVERFYTINSQKQLQSVQLIVPRKNSDIFQEDLYPETLAPLPALEIQDWKNGKDPKLNKISLENGFEPISKMKTENFQNSESIESLKEQLNMAKNRIKNLENEINSLKK